MYSRERRFVEAVRIDMDRLELEPLRVGDRDALGPEREHRLTPLLGDAAVAQPGDRREARERAVDQQLGPDHPAHVARHAHRPDRLELARERLRARAVGAVELADHVAAVGVAHEPPRPDVRAAPLDDARQQVPGADDRLHAVLDQPVAERDERGDAAARDERLERDVVQRRLDGDERVVVVAFELVGRFDGVEPHRVLGAVLLVDEARVAHGRDVLGVGVEHGDVAAQLGGGDPADRPAADDEDPGHAA